MWLGTFHADLSSPVVPLATGIYEINDFDVIEQMALNICWGLRCR